MATGLHKDSRYRVLRGKSVSEPRRNFDQALSEHMDGITPPPLRLHNPSSWRRQSKSQEYTSSMHSSMDDLHSLLTSVPPLPFSQKEHTTTTRPKAAVMPSRPEFGQSSSPTLHELRKVDQTTTTTTVDDAFFSDKIATLGEQAQEDGPEAEGSMEQHDEQPVGLEDTNSATLTPQREHSPFFQTEAETDRMLAEQKRLLHQHLMSTEVAAASMTSLPSTSTFTFTTRTPPKCLLLGKLNSFVRGRRATLSPASSTAPSVSSDQTRSTEPLLPSATRTGYAQQLMTPPTSPVPLPHGHSMDHVYVRYRGQYAKISITDSTDTVDILRQASMVMTNPINQSASVVSECYASLGLERRLRRYERVGEVVDSWPRDAQNSMVIRHALDLKSDKDLDFASVPQTPPGFILQLYYCSRPGKWWKRWITLLQDGSVFASKKPVSSFVEHDCQQVCHLSVCDIYTPIIEPAVLSDPHRQSRSPRGNAMKSLKPPKKHVLALKSQSRATAYLNPDNYASYFCTDDQAVASRFYDMVHAWRSWYMVKVCKQSQRKPLMDTADMEPPPQITPVKHQPRRSVAYLKVTPRHQLRVSRDETPYTIGEIGNEPLIDMERFDKPLEDYGKDWIPVPWQPGLPTNDTSETGDSGVSMTTSSGEVLLDGKDSFEASSPSEDRRKRRDPNRTLTGSRNGTIQIVTTEGTAGVSISVTEPQSDEHSTPPEPPKPLPSPWLPSASEHTARIRAIDPQSSATFYPSRPATSSGMVGRNSLQPPTGGRRRRAHPHHHNRPNTTLPPDLQLGYLNATRYLEQQPSSAQRIMASRPSLPALNAAAAAAAAAAAPSSSAKRGVPALWREASVSSTRQSTSGAERVTSNCRQQARGRASSGGVSGPRRGSGVPLHLRTKARDVNVRAAAGLSAPNMLPGGKGWATRPSDSSKYAGERL